LNKKLKSFKCLQILISIIYLIFMMGLGGFCVTILPLQLFELDFALFLLNLFFVMILFVILYYIVFFLSIIWHEFGHFIFGLKARLNFVCFNVLGYTIYIENNRIKIKKEAKIPGIKGYCNMATEKNKKYDINSIKLYYMGGIIFNFISAIASILLIIFMSNIYLKMIFVMNVGVNIYSALNNLIPATTPSGVITDALHLIYCLNDDEYINTISKLHTLQSLLANGTKLKDIDTNLLSMPQNFRTNSDVLNAMLYVDYLSSKEKYQEAIECAEKILEDAKELLSKTHVITLKLQLIICFYNNNNDFENIKEIWNEDIKKYLDLMGKVNPVYISINYMYSTLVEKNEGNSKKYINKFQQLNKSNYDKYQVEEAEQLINEVNDKKIMHKA